MLSKPVAETAVYYEGHELTSMEQARNYYAWLMHEFGPALRGKTLEIGAGTGTLSEKLLLGSCDQLICLEPAVNLVPILEGRLRLLTNGDVSVDVIANTFEDYSGDAADEGVDSIVCVNVLEHIADDLKALQEMRRLLSRGGKLCLFVPALPFIYGTLDEAFGHYRRYTKHRLGNLARQAGFKVTKLKYFNLPGSLAWLLMGRVLHWKSWDESPVKWYDRLVIPGVRLVESLSAPPFGQSLLLIAEA